MNENNKTIFNNIIFPILVAVIASFITTNFFFNTRIEEEVKKQLVAEKKLLENSVYREICALTTFRVHLYTINNSECSIPDYVNRGIERNLFNKRLSNVYENKHLIRDSLVNSFFMKIYDIVTINPMPNINNQESNDSILTSQWNNKDFLDNWIYLNDTLRTLTYIY